MRARIATLLATALVGALAQGCSDDIDCGEGAYLEGNECKGTIPARCGLGTRLENGACVPDEGGGARCGPGTHLEAGSCIPDVGVGANAVRLFDVSLTEPAQFAPLASGPLNEAFRSGENLFFLGVHQPTKDAVEVYGGGGTRNDGWFVLDRTLGFSAPVLPGTGRITTGQFTWSLNAFGTSTPIKLVNATLRDGVIEVKDGVPLVVAGTLSGVVTPEAADKVYIESANETLLMLLNQVGVAPDVDLSGDGKNESWTMTLKFTSLPIWLF